MFESILETPKIRQRHDCTVSGFRLSNQPVRRDHKYQPVINTQNTILCVFEWQYFVNTEFTSLRTYSWFVPLDSLVRQWFDLSQLSGFFCWRKDRNLETLPELQSLDFHSVSSRGIHWGLVNPCRIRHWKLFTNILRIIVCFWKTWMKLSGITEFRWIEPFRRKVTQMFVILTWEVKMWQI